MSTWVQDELPIDPPLDLWQEDPELDLFIEGHPAPKGSKRHVGRGRMVEVSPLLPAWDLALDEQLPALIPQGFERMEEEVMVSHIFVMPRPRAHYHGNGTLKKDAPFWHSKQPDYDKLARAVNDALTRAGVWSDDSRVVRGVSDKVYGGGNEGPTGVRVRVWRRLPPTGA